MAISNLVLTMGGTANEVSQGGVTFSFADSYQVGNFDDGPCWVRVPGGTATVTGITPAQTANIDGLVIGGAVKNFVWGGTQAFDQRSSVTFGTPLPFPATIQAGDVIIKAVPHTSTDIVPSGTVLPAWSSGVSYSAGQHVVGASGRTYTAQTSGTSGATQPSHTSGSVSDGGVTWLYTITNTRRGLCDEVATLFVVSEVPAPGSLSPAAVGWTGRTLTAYTPNIASFVASLPPGYATTGQTVVPYADIIAHIGRHAPLSISVNNPAFYQDFLPRNFGDETDQGGNYGENVNEWINAACLALISAGYTTAQKEELAKWLISFGIQCGDPLEQVTAPVPNGGHYQFQLGPIAVARQATGRSNASVVADMGINWAGAFQFNASLLARLTPHTSDGEPFTWRERTVADTVSGNVVPILCTQSLVRDPSQVDFRSLRLRRKSDGATALVTASVSRGSSATSITANTTTIVDLTIDAQPTPPFANGQAVDFVAPWTISDGDYDWAINGPGVFNFYNPSPEAVYRSLNRWTGQALLIKAAGWSGDFGAALGYVNRCNAANDPAGDDFPAHHRTTWEGQFWAQHAATIYA